MLVPVAFSLNAYGAGHRPGYPGSNEPLAVLRTYAQKTAQDGEEVLFINQRQLLTFGYIPGVPLVPEYELLTLMEMAMSNNRPYLERFYSDLDRHRFALIVAPSLRSESHFVEQFSDEDNVWAESVDRILACEYRVKLSLPEVGVEILVPQPENRKCP
jgi:hypothetical protein